ncbi:hypothetical protein FSP39_001869 [Pinctada imbricata]|uniref:Tyr recombinase domain-containing protein n=1 Tax=Pinctada imbricata TaxID=66713 RepID=A0AA88YS34_PINIB|nr:hypothetical protein FSP39_001869 [Pinctada imbricata]
MVKLWIFTPYSVEDLNNHPRRFYGEVQPKIDHSVGKENEPSGGGEYHKSTMKGLRAAINRHLSDIGRNIDIVRDREFKQANAALDGKLKQNMKMGLSKPTQHKPVITPNDLSNISTYLMSDLNPVILRYRVWYDLSIHFVSRGLEFHQQLNINSFLFLSDDKGCEYVALSHETKQKNWQGGLESKEAPQDKRMYATGEFCPVASLKTFLNHTDTEATSLFNHINKDAIKSPESTDIWYTTKPVKQYQFSRFMADISRNAKCLINYTAHCLRSTAIQALNDEGFEQRHIMYMSGHRNEASVRSYNRDCSTDQKQNLSLALAKVARPSIPSATVSRPTDDNTTAAVTAPAPTPLGFPAMGPPAMSVNNNTHNNLSHRMSSSFITNSAFNNCTFNFATNPFTSD